MENELKFSTKKKERMYSLSYIAVTTVTIIIIILIIMRYIWYFKTFEQITELHLKKFKTNLTPPAKQVPLQ